MSLINKPAGTAHNAGGFEIEIANGAVHVLSVYQDSRFAGAFRPRMMVFHPADARALAYMLNLSADSIESKIKSFTVDGYETVDESKPNPEPKAAVDPGGADHSQAAPAPATDA